MDYDTTRNLYERVPLQRLVAELERLNKQWQGVPTTDPSYPAACRTRGILHELIHERKQTLQSNIDDLTTI